MARDDFDVGYGGNDEDNGENSDGSEDVHVVEFDVSGRV